MKSCFLISLLIISISGRDEIYMCHDDPFIDEQCLKAESIGGNNFVWLRKCKGSKVCVRLPYYGGITGSCIIKVRSHYDGESCANGNKCTSGICDGTKCIGKEKGVQCEPGLGQCAKGLLCRKELFPISENRQLVRHLVSDVFTCQDPIAPGAVCSNLGGSSFDGEYLLEPKYLDPGYNVCTLGYTCDKPEDSAVIFTGKCIKIGSLTLTSGTGIQNPLACETGLAVTSSPGNCVASLTSGLFTSLGDTFTNYANATRHFHSWLEASTYDDDTEDEDAIYEAYRYTRNKKKINELWFRYIQAHRVDDADECAYDYFWKQSSSNYIQFSFMIFALLLLF